jgi:hypothetical protein
MSEEKSFTARVLFAAPEVSLSNTPVGVRIAVQRERVSSDMLERALANAWYWPEASEVIATHQSHVELSLATNEGSPVERALALTEALTAIAKEPRAIAVLWDSTALLHDAEQWIAQSEDANAEDLPLFLWLAFEGTERDDGTRSLRTRGLGDFGDLEVEVASSRRDGEEVLEIVCDVALLVLTSSAPLEDGEQVEVTRGKVRVRIEPSLRGDGTKAYRLRLP